MIYVNTEFRVSFEGNQFSPRNSVPSFRPKNTYCSYFSFNCGTFAEMCLFLDFCFGFMSDPKIHVVFHIFLAFAENCEHMFFSGFLFCTFVTMFYADD